MDSYLSGDSRNVRRPNVSSWVIWGAVKKSGSEILIKGREMTAYRPSHPNLLSIVSKPLFLQLASRGFSDFVTHHKDKPEWERVLGTWSKLHVRNSSTFEFQDWNIFRKKWASDMARGRALDEGAIPCGWLFGFSFSFSLVRLLNIRQDNYTVLYFMKDTFQASQWLASAQDGTSWSSL